MVMSAKKAQSLKDLFSILNEFHEYQLEYAIKNNGLAYEYNTLGLAEWLEFYKKVKEL